MGGKYVCFCTLPDMYIQIANFDQLSNFFLFPIFFSLYVFVLRERCYTCQEYTSFALFCFEFGTIGSLLEKLVALTRAGLSREARRSAVSCHYAETAWPRTPPSPPPPFSGFAAGAAVSGAAAGSFLPGICSAALSSVAFTPPVRQPRKE